MFKKLKLDNFKAWEKSNEIELKPITLILGTNSSGKSSLIQSLLLLKQTAESPDRTIHINLGGDEVNDLFSFGNFENILNQHTSGTRNFSIEFEFSRLDDERVKDGFFSCTYGQASSGAVIIQSLTLGTGQYNYKAVRREKGAYSILVGDETQPRIKGRNYAPQRSISFSSDATDALEKDGELVQDISLTLSRELRGIRYLGPLRRKPERDYPWNKSKPGEIGVDGHGAIDALFASAVLKTDEQDYIIKGVSSWLSRMNVAEKMEVRQQGRSNRYEILIHRDNTISNLRDVGIGVSQILPVLVLCYFAPEGSTIILEEPEIHLHPLAQSQLAELFVAVGRERKLQFIIETHSEHLFRRMQTLIANKTITTDKVAMYFVERENQKSTLNTLEVDEFGRIKNWPENFFGSALEETRQQAMHTFKRQMEDKK